MMTTRKEILQVLEEFGALYPEWRFGQLVVNITNLANVGEPREVWDVEDSEFLAAARRHLERQRKNKGEEAKSPCGIPQHQSPNGAKIR